jgi:translation initiation factor eIF-2B subunit alpha
MVRELEDAGVPCTLVLDASIGYIMSEIDYVLVGAEGVVESGGIINRVIIWGGAESETII